MSKDIKTGQRASRQQTPTKIIVERRYVGTEKMETVFRRIAEEQISKKLRKLLKTTVISSGNGKGNIV